MIVLQAILFLVLGAMAGAIHFLAISKDAEVLVRGGSTIRALSFRLGRLLLTISVLVLAARQGGAALLAAGAGLIAARAAVIRRLGPTP